MIVLLLLAQVGEFNRIQAAASSTAPPPSIAESLKVEMGALPKGMREKDVVELERKLSSQLSRLPAKVKQRAIELTTSSHLRLNRQLAETGIAVHPLALRLRRARDLEAAIAAARK